MSGFGGGFGAGGRSSSSGGRGTRGGRSSRGRGRGRGRSNSNNGGGRDGGPGTNNSTNFPKALLNPCGNFTKTGNCPRGNTCSFAHVVKLHGVIDASSPKQDQPSQSNNGYNSNVRYNNVPEMYPVSSVALWKTGGAMKLFTGSQDGCWRLWNFVPNTGFVKEFEHHMGGAVYSLVVASNFLFCGFENISPLLP